MTTHTTITTATSATPTGQLALDFTAAPPPPATPRPTPPPQAVTAPPAGTMDAPDDRTPSQRRADAARDTLAAGLAGLRDDPSALAGYLAFSAHFRDYSPRKRKLQGGRGDPVLAVTALTSCRRGTSSARLLVGEEPERVRHDDEGTALVERDGQADPEPEQRRRD